MQANYEQTLRSMIVNPDAHISDVELIAETERETLVAIGVGPSADYPRNSCLHELFEQQAERTPDALALRFRDEVLTYQELNNRANRLAGRLRYLGTKPGVLVGVCLQRSADIAIAILAVLKAGGAYLPIDPLYPRDRVTFLLEDSRATVLISNTNLKDSLPRGSASVLLVDDPTDMSDAQLARSSEARATPDDLAYVIYTSGSTGKPKGVEVTHRSVVNFLASMRREPGISPQDSLFAVTTLSFDIAGLEFYLPLTSGACVVVAPQAALVDGPALARLMRESGITMMQATPVTWRLLLDSGWNPDREFKILCGGEALTRELANRLLATGAEVWNLYGPTETTIWSAIHRVDSRPGPVSIGRPIANTQFYILDEHQKMLPRGALGELYIGGDGLARGYLRRPELTAERFLPDPFGSGGKLYRTGDLVRWLADGNLEYLGRLDHQVKLRGFRIEMGEVEATLEQLPHIRQAIATVREDTPGDPRLLAYVVYDGTAPEASALREALLARLPEYMVPSHFFFLKSFPLTPNGKVDRKALPAPEKATNVSAHFVPPKTDSEARVAAIWQELLKHDRVGADDNFFDLGGHSLLVVQLQASLRQRFHQEISLVELFQRPTVSAIAALLDARRGCGASLPDNSAGGAGLSALSL